MGLIGFGEKNWIRNVLFSWLVLEYQKCVDKSFLIKWQQYTFWNIIKGYAHKSLTTRDAF